MDNAYSDGIMHNDDIGDGNTLSVNELIKIAAEDDKRRFDQFKNIIRVKGIIPAGRNEIAIVYDSMNPGYDSVGGLQNDIFTLGFAPSFVSGGYPVTFNFSFTMLTSWDSYNRIIIDTSAPPLDENAESFAPPQGGGASSGGEEIGGENLDDGP